jgi:hypothetical protein
MPKSWPIGRNRTHLPEFTQMLQLALLKARRQSPSRRVALPAQRTAAPSWASQSWLTLDRSPCPPRSSSKTDLQQARAHCAPGTLVNLGVATVGHTGCASWTPLKPILAALAFDAPMSRDGAGSEAGQLWGEGSV